MSETVAELAATDALLTALSQGARRPGRSGDRVLDALGAWADEISSHPVPDFPLELPDPFTDPTTSRTWRIAATAIAVTAMSSSGIAAAATGDPLAPFNYVATALGNLTPTDRADQIRFGAPPLDPGRPATGPSQAGPGSTDALDLFWPQAVNGRHRADDGAGQAGGPKHRASASAEAASNGESGAYKPRHVASQTPTETPPTETPPTETPPAETPPVETPPVETPPAEPQPPASDPAPTPEPGGGTSSGGNVAGGTNTESGGQEAVGDVPADAVQMKVDDASAGSADSTVDGV